MNRQQIELVTKSWDIISKINMEVVGGLFYARLFEIAPDVIPMFRNIPMQEQSRKLLSMLSYIIENLDTLNEVQADVVKLAERHKGYGVKEVHYAAVGKSLLWTLEKAMGDYWNDDLNAAWMEVYTTLATAMIGAPQKETSVVSAM